MASRASQHKDRLLERFLNYISIDTQSKVGATMSPSSSGQLKLAKYLVQEVKALGLEQIELSEQGVVTAYLPAPQQGNGVPTIGLVAHLDTSPQVSGKNVKPEVIENYRGGDIALGIGEAFISPVHFPFLQQLIGKTLIVTDGNTLLGADNKAGIAEIMTALSVLKESKTERANIRVVFMPDEEIGLGMNFFPLERFSCDWAYTIDGGEVGELEYENFNAANAVVTIYGHGIHPGLAKDKMVNALALACEFQQYFPKNETPETTEGKAGFYHLDGLEGDIEKVQLHYIIRDFDGDNFVRRKAFIAQAVQDFNRNKQLKRQVEVQITDIYRNMYDVVQTVPQAIELAEQAMKKCGITPLHKAIRGGTDGAKLAEMGIACPNIFTGGYNFHSKQELITLEGMVSAVDVIITMAELASEMSN
ncbi:peptidase T [Conservatibacter flavescens]|uniref:Peptidase T n=1 Tax=Conservatibacter flavescens TaxID=28161 RepID=A0A2M8S238_9PAST|nr:peptidase T [Conservatibacter flavescens]PJG85178.1 peptidase T [Conservatibacter flavescens]